MPRQPFTWNGTNPDGTPLRWNQPGLTWNGFIPEPQPSPRKMPQLRVLLGFSNATDHDIIERTEDILGGLYVSPLWNPLPAGVAFPVAQADLEAARDAFMEAMAKADMGGPPDTADKHNKRDTLVALLRKLAGFVQENHGNDMARLLASGFDAVSTNRVQSPLPKPNIRDIRHGNSGQLIVRVEPIRNARNFEAQHALIGPGGTPGPWQSAGLFSDSRAILLNGLTPGAECLIRVRALGGSTGSSEWSDAQSSRSL
jgi:hypothetical protein